MAVRICVSLSNRDLSLIDSFCKKTHKNRSAFLIQTAISEIKNNNHPETNNGSSLWTKLVGR